MVEAKHRIECAAALLSVRTIIGAARIDPNVKVSAHAMLCISRSLANLPLARITVLPISI